MEELMKRHGWGPEERGIANALVWNFLLKKKIFLKFSTRKKIRSIWTDFEVSKNSNFGPTLYNEGYGAFDLTVA